MTDPPATAGASGARQWARQLWRLHPALLAGVGLGCVVALAWPASWNATPVTRALAAWNLGVCLYLALTARLVIGAEPDALKARASIEDESRGMVLTLVLLAAMASLAAIAVELGHARTLQGWARGWSTGLAALTVISSWLLMHTAFALHYAHEFHCRSTSSSPPGSRGGLEFPGPDAPDYLDFFYFSSVLGTSAQTADVAISSRRMRRLGLLHGVLSFFFNTTLLALLVNVSSSLL